MVDFQNKLKDWLNENGFSEVKEIQLGPEFAYDINKQSIIIGLTDDHLVGEWFEEFLSSYGCKYSDIPYTILAFLHELGHNQTVNQFTSDELIYCALVKTTHKIKDLNNLKEYLFEYWCVPDEFAANKWLINFVNTHVVAIANLWTNVFEPFWNDRKE